MNRSLFVVPEQDYVRDLEKERLPRETTRRCPASLVILTNVSMHMISTNPLRQPPSMRPLAIERRTRQASANASSIRLKSPTAMIVFVAPSIHFPWLWNQSRATASDLPAGRTGTSRRLRGKSPSATSERLARANPIFPR